MARATQARPRTKLQPSTGQLVTAIADDVRLLVRKEMELARQELLEAVTARIKSVAAMSAAGLLALFGLVFAALAASTALDNVVSPWAGRLIVTGAFVLLAGAAAVFGMRRMRHPSLMPEETKRTVKEDIEWAKAQLKR